MATIGKYEVKNGYRYRVRYRQDNGKYTDQRGFRTKREAELWMAQYVLDRNTGTFIDPARQRTPIDGFIGEFLDRKGSRSANTLAARESQAENWVIPYWTGRPLISITADAINEWVEAMRDHGAGQDTIAKSHRILRGTLDIAVDKRYLHSNPTPKLSRTKQNKKQHAYLTHAEIAELASAIQPHFSLLVRTLAYTGLRFGEAAALTPASFDAGRKRLHINRSVAEVHGELVWGPTKNGKSRTVVYPDFLHEPLQALVAAAAHDAPIFTARLGGPLRLASWRTRYFYPAIKDINASRTTNDQRPFPAITPHDLRHTAASLAVQAGANVKSVQRMLGHQSAAMTLDVYADLFDTDLDDVAARMHAAAQHAADASPDSQATP